MSTTGQLLTTNTWWCSKLFPQNILVVIILENLSVKYFTDFTYYGISPFKFTSLAIWHLKLVSRNNNMSVTPHLIYNKFILATNWNLVGRILKWVGKKPVYRSPLWALKRHITCICAYLVTALIYVRTCPYTHNHIHTCM